MLTVMCPNCRHRFPAPGCCEPADGLQNENERNSSNDMVHPSGCYYGGGLLVPRGYTSGGGCFINAPTIVHGPAIIQTGGGQQCSTNTIGNVDPSKYLQRVQRETRKTAESRDIYGAPSECHVATTCDLTGGTVTITTPSIQSGGCLIQSTDSGILVQAPQIEIRPKLSGGGCLVQKRVAEQDVGPVLANEDCSESKYAGEPMNSCCNAVKSHGHRKLFLPPSGCQELPGTRRNLVRNSNAPSVEHHLMQDVGELNDFVNEDEELRYGFEATSSPDVQVRTRVFATDETERQNEQNQQQQQVHGHSDSCQDPIFRPQSRKSCCCSNTSNLSQGQTRPASHSGIPNVNGAKNLSENTFSKCLDNRDSLQIQVNATVQLPASLGQCTVNITATTANNLSSAPNTRVRNNFNGGGLVENAPPSNQVVNANERRDGAPTTPVSWLMPCPWSFDTFFIGKEMATLCEVKRLLQICGWYHEGLSWQQSESLLKNAPVGRWLMRDSSDSRYTFAVSVQTARGPTSVRVHHFLGKFRLDAEPRLALAMPMFDCPIKMLEHYVDYSKRMDEHRREVWVDYSGQLYSEIYLTKPLVKEVRSLSHLARLAVNRNKLPTDQLPPLIKNYLAEYPYTL